MAPTDQFSPTKDVYSEYGSQSLQPEAGETVMGYPITPGTPTPETIQIIKGVARDIPLRGRFSENIREGYYENKQESHTQNDCS